MALNELAVFVLVTARAAGVFAAPGWIGADALPILLRGGLAAAIGLVLTPWLAQRGAGVPGTPEVLLGALAWNFAVGLALGFGVSLLWSVAEMAGSVAELAVGLNPAAILGTEGASAATSLGQCYPLMLALLFFGGGGLEQWIAALQESFSTVPLAGALPTASPSLALVPVVGRLLGVAVALAAPVLLSLLIVNLTLAVAGRLTAQTALYMAALPAELGTALLALTLTVGVTVVLEGRLLGGLSGVLESARRVVAP